MRMPGAIEIVRKADHLGAGPGARPGMAQHLVAVAEPIDQLCLDRLLRKERAAVDQVAHLGIRQFAALRDPVDDLSRNRAEQRLDLLAMRRGHLGFGQHIHRGLEFFAMIELRDDPEKIEGALQERGIGIETGQADIAHRLQPDLVERGCEIIWPGSGAELAEAVGESERELALAAERGDRVAHFLDPGEAHLVVADPGEQYLDAGIVAGGLDRIEEIAQGRLRADQEPHDRLFAGAFRQIPGQIDGQENVAGKRRHRRPQAADQQHDAGDEQHGREADDRKKAYKETPHAWSVSEISGPISSLIRLGRAWPGHPRL